MRHPPILPLVLLVAAAAACSASGSSGSPPTGGPTDSVSASPKVGPGGDIPDSTVFVPYRAASGGYVISVPEGWARTSSGGTVTFTNNLNSVTLTSMRQKSAPSETSARQTTVPQLQTSVTHFALVGISTVQRKAGSAVEIRYETDSAPNPVTGKVVRDDVQRYEFFHNGTELDVLVTGPVGGDNVDASRTITDSLQWQ